MLTGVQGPMISLILQKRRPWIACCDLILSVVFEGPNYRSADACRSDPGFRPDARIELRDHPREAAW